ncbi:ATP-dependent Clp protease ATP-binding subunit ClpX [Agaribacterium haliotis]|uniref:ATP-dependent Clp protease ATP-binding subunit ClpX n=1 Tax=Agaribacterium haliotis TaxID=2013869 RepID=UPI000BB55F20|nr:ATP-dependent Clp protease ATP-binding subunit ClpX [Agaribacterium haliotis]
MPDTQGTACSFCGVEKSAEVPLISGNAACICEECVKLAFRVVSSWGHTAKKDDTTAGAGDGVTHERLQTPYEIKQHLDQFVVGQERAKETLAVAVYSHYLRLFFNRQHSLEPDDSSVELEKSNILLLGPSGTGKTLLVRSLAKALGVPLLIVDATALTQAGYVGDDVDSIMQRLLEAADGDVQRAQWGVVYIDEIDKIAKRGGGEANARDVSGEGVQQALLKLVEGSELKISTDERRRHKYEDCLMTSTNVLFIAGGAFPGIEQQICQRLQPEGAKIGFHAEPSSETPNINKLLEHLLPDDLQAFGLIPEFIGRFPVISFLKPLDEQALLAVLTEPKNALVKQYKKLFAYQGLSFDISSEALAYIAQQALLRNTGARGLRSIMESALHSTLFDIPSMENITACYLQLVDDPQGKKLQVRYSKDLADGAASELGHSSISGAGSGVNSKQKSAST